MPHRAAAAADFFSQIANCRTESASNLDGSQWRRLYCAAMTVLIGVDEAGYGPNFGPLVVAATAWRVDQESGVSGQGSKRVLIHKPAGCATKRAVASSPTAHGFPDLYKLLRKAVVRSPAESSRRLAIADSKALYKAGFGVKQLERGVLAALAATEGATGRGSGMLPASSAACVERVAELLAATGADPDGRRRELACHGDDEQVLPLESLAKEICELAAKLRQACEQNGVALIAIRARFIFPAEFNALVDYFGTKGGALSHVTLELVRRVVDEVTDAGVGDEPARLDSMLICLDKHGGRNRYTALLQHHFPDSWIEPISENRNRSRYQWRHGEMTVEAHFRVGCEELLPTALASMTAKYHRELAMRAFNAFWTSRLPELRATAGYPGDSHRFKAEIQSLQRELGIDDRVLWRSR
jgi:hypothetical protein